MIHRVYTADISRVNPDDKTMSYISPADRALASTLAKTLIHRRHELGLTQEQVALAAHIDRNHYQLMEHGRSDRKTNRPSNPRLSTLITLSKVLQMDVTDLLEDALRDYAKNDTPTQP